MLSCYLKKKKKQQTMETAQKKTVLINEFLEFMPF